MRDAASSSLLIDTHLIIWWGNDHRRMPNEAKAAIEAPYGRRVVSVITLWEIAIKRAKGKLAFDVERMHVELAQRNFDVLAVESRHVEALAGLPRLHGDPFDRMMVAQAESEGLTFLTADARLGAYGPCVRVV